MRKALLVSAVAAGALQTASAAAQTAPRPAPPPFVPPPSASASAAAALAALPAPPPVDDPMLAPVPPPRRIVSSWMEAQGLMRARSTNLKTALDQVLNAEGQTIVALAQYLPQFGGCSGGTGSGCLNGQYTHQLLTNTAQEKAIGTVATNVVPIPNTYTSSVSVSQDLINVSEFDQISIDELAEDANRMTVDDTRRTLSLSLANQIVAVVTAERSAEINRTGLRVALEQLELTKRKEALGAATSLDVVRAKQNAAAARVALVNGDEALRQAREALGITLGVPEEVGVSHDMNVNGIDQDAMRSCRSVTSIDSRPDVASARISLEVAKRNLRNTWFSYLPSLGGSSQMTLTSAVNAGYPNPTWSIGAALSIPIFDGGTRWGTIKSERALEDIAAQNLESLRRQNIIQVEQAQRGIEVAEVSYKVALEQRDLAAQNDTMTQAAYARGQGTSVDLVTASEAHRQAEQALAVAEFGEVKARIAALLAMATCPW